VLKLQEDYREGTITGLTDSDLLYPTATILYHKTGFDVLGSSFEYFARAFRQGREYVIQLLIIFATAAMDYMYERLCWLYITVKNTLVFDYIGNTDHLSDPTE
jgi:hypothetical protein